MVKNKIIHWRKSAIIFTGLLASCSNYPYKTHDSISPEPVIDRVSFEEIDLAILLNPIPSESLKSHEGNVVEQKRVLSKAFEAFYQGGQQETRRNRVQERILGASRLRCGVYKDSLKRFDSTYNILFGSATTITAGLGAILTGLDAVRALSGAAAIFSGLRSEFTEAFFQQLTIQVLTNSIELKRSRVYEDINVRQGQDITSYPVEAAIKDAIEYDDNCSLIAGLEEAALTIARESDPGLRTLARVRGQFAELTDPRIATLGLGSQAGSILTTLPSAALEQAKKGKQKLAGLVIPPTDALEVEFNTKLDALDAGLDRLDPALLPSGSDVDSYKREKRNNIKQFRGSLKKLIKTEEGLTIQVNELLNEDEDVKALDSADAEKIQEKELAFLDAQRALGSADADERTEKLGERDAAALAIRSLFQKYNSTNSRIRAIISEIEAQERQTSELKRQIDAAE